jgi:hypothetical protein
MTTNTRSTPNPNLSLSVGAVNAFRHVQRLQDTADAWLLAAEAVAALISEAKLQHRSPLAQVYAQIEAQAEAARLKVAEVQQLRVKERPVTPRPTGQRAARTEPRLVAVRTPAQRAAYDKAVLSALEAKAGTMLAREVADVAAGSPEQVRNSLRRLVEAGCVEWSGRTAGTRYRAAPKAA